MAPFTSNIQDYGSERTCEFRCPHSAIRKLVPSRHSNPFATCWTRPGAIQYVFPPEQCAEQMVQSLADQDWRGEIVGPHGSGKSTLLATLLPHLNAAGRDVRLISLHDRQRRLPRGWINRALVGGVSDTDTGLGSQAVIGVRDASHRNGACRTILIIDGYEQLSRWRRWSVRFRCRRAGAGLLVTSHAHIGLPTLFCTSPDLSLVERLVEILAQRGSSTVRENDIVASHACHGSNVREILFDLYDLHERRMRAQRTLAACGT